MSISSRFNLNPTSPLRRRAFSLIELLVVVGIIAILAAIAIPNFLEAQTRSKVARVKADLRTIATGMEAYCVDNRGYPPDWDSGVYPGITVFNDEGPVYGSLTSPVAYLSTIPRDPFNDTIITRPQFYEYYHEDAVNKRNADTWASTWKAAGIRWFAYSFGPDGQNDLLAQDQTLAIERMYDPTNGTVSAGDIGWSNTGPIPR